MSVVVNSRWVHQAPSLLALHDSGPAAWIIVAGYVVAAISCGLAAHCARACPQGKFWTATALLVAALGVNKQLDLQTWLTFLGRRLAQSDGWYAERRAVEGAFLIIFAGLSVVLAAWFLRSARPNFRGRAATISGLAALGGYAILRAATFYHVDSQPDLIIATLPVRDVLEFSGTILVAIGAWRSRAAARSAFKRS